MKYNVCVSKEVVCLCFEVSQDMIVITEYGRLFFQSMNYIKNVGS